MVGNIKFPVICVLVCTVALSVAQPPPPFMRRHNPMSWGVPNEIFASTGGGPAFRPPPGLLVAGHGPPGSRRIGPVRHGGRPPFPLLTSTSTPTPSVWPSHGPQIQRAKETSHFEYEVVPRLPKPPTILRAAPSRHTSHRLAPSIPTQMTTTRFPPHALQFLGHQDFTTLRPQSRTDRPPPFIVTSGPPVGPPTYATPSDADFQEGFRVLNDLFMEDAGGDIRNNLVGGSDVSFSGGYYPPLNRSGNIPPNRAELEPAIHITPAKEQGILIAGSPPRFEEMPSEKARPSIRGDQKVQATNIEYGPPGYQPGPPQSHSSFMYSDPNEPSGTYNLYDAGYQPGPPPPFHTIGNSINPQPIPPPRQPTEEMSETSAPSISQNNQEVSTQMPPQNEGGYSGPPPQSEGGYSGPPPQSEGGYSGPPPQMEGGYNGPPPQSEGGYSGPPPQSEGGYSPPPPQNEGATTSSDSASNAPIPMPMMMMPIIPEQSANEALPTSEEVQRALGILSRYASKQAQSMGMSVSPQMMLQMAQPDPPSSKYGSPQEQMEQQEKASTPSSAYGAPPQQQQTATPSTNYGTPSTPTYVSLQFTPPPDPSTFTNSIQMPSMPFSTTTEAADAITISASPEESSPYPTYGAPQVQMMQFSGSSGYETNVGGGGNNGYSSQDQSSGGYSSQGQSSSSGGYSSVSSSSGGYSSGGGWSSQGGSGGGGGGGVGGGVAELIGAKVNTLKTLRTAVTGGIQQVGALKAGILNAGLNVLGGIGHAKGNLANSLKIPIMSTQPMATYGPPSTTTTTATTPSEEYGPPQMGWGSGMDGGGAGEGPITALVKVAGGVVKGITGTLAAGGKAAVGIGASKINFGRNHFLIKGKAFSDVVTKQVANKNEYFRNVLKHIGNIFEAGKPPAQMAGWSRR